MNVLLRPCALKLTSARCLCHHLRKIECIELPYCILKGMMYDKSQHKFQLTNYKIKFQKLLPGYLIPYYCPGLKNRVFLYINIIFFLNGGHEIICFEVPVD